MGKIQSKIEREPEAPGIPQGWPQPQRRRKEERWIKSSYAD